MHHGLDHGVAEQPGLGMGDGAIAPNDTRERDHIRVVSGSQDRDGEMGKRELESRRSTQRGIDQRQQASTRPTLTRGGRKAQANILAIALLDKHVVPLRRDKKGIEGLLQFIFGHRGDCRKARPPSHPVRLFWTAAVSPAVQRP